MHTQYKIRGTDVVSPYPAELTPAEARMVYSLQKHFSPSEIFPDYYAFKVSALTKRAYNSNFMVSADWRELDGSEYTQIDCIAVNKQGIFVFESKDYVGFIYGRGQQVKWTQVYEYGREKRQFYNPVKQNATHVRAIADFLDKDLPIYSVLVFGVESTLKSVTGLPPRCYACTQPGIHDCLSKIHNPKPLSIVTIAQVHKALEQNRIPSTAIVRKDHADDIQETLDYRENHFKHKSKLAR